MRLNIESLNGHLSLQGPPSVRVRHFGIPTGGPFDNVASRTANALLGNRSFDVVAEIALCTATWTVTEPGWLAWCGSGQRLRLDGLDVAPWSRFYVHQGQRLETLPTASGLRGYMAAHGGLVYIQADGSKVVGLASLDDRPHDAAARLADGPEQERDSPLRYVGLGLPPIGPAVVTNRIDRVGLRMTPEVPLPTTGSALSRPTVVGCVQMTPDGEYLVHGPDGPTIGGYDSVGVVCRVDVPRLAQLRPGERIGFRQVTVEEALVAYRDCEALLAFSWDRLHDRPDPRP